VKIAIVTVISKDKKFLVIRRSELSNKTGQWESPAGHIDKGESPEEAAIRELKEEAGLEAKFFPKRKIIDIVSGGKGMIFLGGIPRNSNEIKVTLNPKEHDKYKWLSLAEIMRLENTPPDFGKNVMAIIKMNKKNKLKVSSSRIRKATLGEIQDLVLVGDEVKIFLESLLEEKNDVVLEGKIERTSPNSLWIRKPDESVEKKEKEDWLGVDWSFVTVKRNGKTLQFKRGNPLDESKNKSESSKGLGLIIDVGSPIKTESVFRCLSGQDKYDLDQTIENGINDFRSLAPNKTKYKVYRQVRDFLKGSNLEDGISLIDPLDSQRVLILTHDKDVKDTIKKLMKKYGNEITETKTGAMVVAINNGVMPTQGAQGMNQATLTIPDPNQQVNDLKKMTKSMPKKTPNGLQFNVDPKALGLLAKKDLLGLRNKMNLGDYRTAGLHLEALERLGIKESTFKRISPRIASKRQWKELELYLNNKGELNSGRIAGIMGN
jgi:8-oxo-dGTP pyrophosphatase MutT (NUDIX family)